jgi:cytochrome c
MKGVFGRPAASDRQFTYSDSLKKSQVLWDARTLDKWLADPDGFVPGNDMSFRLENANERADIIEYLKQLGGHGGEAVANFARRGGRSGCNRGQCAGPACTG